MRFEDLLRDTAAARKEALAEGTVKARTDDIVRAFDAFKDTGIDSDTAMSMLGKIFFEESPEQIREIITKHDSAQKQN